MQSRPLYLPLYTSAQTRELDRLSIRKHGMPGYELMCRAGQAAFDWMVERWPQAKSIVVLAGPGNNGGDGYVLARLAQEAGLAVRLLTVGDHGRLQGEALQAAGQAQAAGVPVSSFALGLLTGADVLVDALLGTGISGVPRPEYAEAIRAINAAGIPVLAIDLPSGLDTDTGSAPGDVVNASATMSFIGRKRGLYTGSDALRAGELRYDDLGVPSAVFREVPASVQMMQPALLGELLPPRRRDGHKGHYGHVLVVGGDHGFAGACAMAAEAAARSGAGLVSVATRSENAAVITARRPEIMCHAVLGAHDLDPLLKKATVVVIGPGLGQSIWGRELFAQVLASGLPLVVDADGLNLLAQQPCQRDNWLLTPHPGEAARLLGSTVPAVQQDRFSAATALATKYGGAVVLKGNGSLVADGGNLALCPFGNPGMGSGGMGDVLSGILGAMLAQGLALQDAARAGVLVHALAGDAAAAEGGERGLLATDLFVPLRKLVNP